LAATAVKKPERHVALLGTYPMVAPVLRTPDLMLSRKFSPAVPARRIRIAIWRNFCQIEEEPNPMGTKTAIISVENLKSADLPALKQALQTVAGVANVEFSVERSVAVIEFDPAQSHIDDFLRAVLKAGFKVL
jgi:hypothetical protein